MTLTELTPRVPPHSLEAEIAVLGSIMLDNDVLDSDAMQGFTSGMFYREGHRKLFEAMTALRAKGDPIDLVTMQELMVRQGTLDEIGGISYLIGLGDQVPTAAYGDHYARIVQEKWTLREVIRQSSQTIRAAYDGEMALEDVLTQAGQIGANLDLRAHQGAYAQSDVIADILRDIAQGTGQQPLSTGLADLDDMLGGGLYPETLNILAARPSMGKSALALGVAEHVGSQLYGRADEGQIVVVSLEMRRHQLVVRMISSAARVHANNVRGAMQGRNVLTPGQQARFTAAANRLGDLPITYLDDAVADATLRTLPAKLRRLHRERPIRLVVIDYLQLMTAGGGENRQQEVSTISRSLKQLARELECPFLVLSQLSRAVEQRPNHRPMLSDLRESGAVEQDADTVMFIYRDEYYNKDTEQQGIAEIIIGKQREGAVGTVKTQFQSDYVKFANLARSNVAAH
ncbi:replicative DNA helicase [Deinococcus sp. PESE-13]